MKKIILFSVFLFISISLICCFLVKVKFTSFVTVKGSSEMQVIADKAYWNIQFVNAGNDLKSLQEKNKNDIDIVSEFLASNGLNKNEFNKSSVELVDLDSREYKDPNQVNRYIMTQTISIQTNKVNLIEYISGDLNSLLEKNVYLKTSYGENKPDYEFTGLNKIKEQMIAEATKNARKSAEQFAKDSNSKIYKIRTADQGLFIILPQDKAVDYNESYSKNKIVRVVSTISYWLK